MNEKTITVTAEALEIKEKLDYITRVSKTSFELESKEEGYALNVRWKDEKKECILFEVIKNNQ